MNQQKKRVLHHIISAYNSMYFVCGAGFVVASCYMFYLAYHDYSHKCILQNDGIETKAVVTEIVKSKSITGGNSYQTLRVTFTDESGISHSALTSKSKNHIVGQEVKVIYSKDDPNLCEISTSRYLTNEMAIFELTLGAIAFLISCVLFYLFRKSTKAKLIRF